MIFGTREEMWSRAEQRVAHLIGRSFDFKVNCFCISEFFFRDTTLRNVTADEMLNFVAENFQQVDHVESQALTLIWSRSSLELPVGTIRMSDLAKRTAGFPFGLILEHSFIQINADTVFQKADPTIASKVEITLLSEAVAPYAQLKGFELTRHIPVVQF